MERKTFVKDISRCQVISPPRPVRVCAYVRVSTGHDGQLNSLRNQTDYYSHKFSNSPHYSFVGVFSDAGISGAKENRPGFLSMLQMAKAGELDLIYTKSISRFARNTLTLLKVVRELKDIGVGVIFEEQNINTLNNEGELMLTVLAGIAEEERKSVRSNVQWAMRKKCLRGEVLVDTNRLLGYSKDGEGKLVIVPEEALIIRRIYQLYLDGMNACQVARILNEQNTLSYTKGPWKGSRVLSIISNEKYAGDCHMQKSFIDENGHQVRNRGQRDQYWMDNSHPAIIPREDWERAQQLRANHAKKTYPYTGLLKCAYCGSSLIRATHSKRWVSWICARCLHLGKAVCIGSRITEARLNEMTKDHPITEPMIVKDVGHGKQKSYRLIPAAQYSQKD